MDRKDLREIRARVCAGLSGQVVEIGFGTGLNPAFYPPGVAKVWAVEPSATCMRLAQPRIAASRVPVELAGLTGERLDLPSESADAVLSTWTMCTIPDLDAALAEMLRVLRPGGELHFVEHGHAPEENIQRWQRRIEPINKKVAGGCHLTRRIPERIAAAGFSIGQLDAFYMAGEPKTHGHIYEGRAAKP